MLSVHKYELKSFGVNKLEMPQFSKILSCQTQNGVLCLWALVNPAHKHVDKSFLVTGTGVNIDYRSFNLNHISTIQDGALVWHVFQILPDA